MSPQGYKNMDLESQDPIFNANLGQDKNLIWTKKLRCSHSIKKYSKASEEWTQSIWYGTIWTQIVYKQAKILYTGSAKIHRMHCKKYLIVSIYWSFLIIWRIIFLNAISKAIHAIFFIWWIWI